MDACYCTNVADKAVNIMQALKLRCLYELESWKKIFDSWCNSDLTRYINMHMTEWKIL